MGDGQSRTGTAEGAALLRAAHLFVDDDPKILEDLLPLSLI
jgi:hypothetical protein